MGEREIGNLTPIRGVLEKLDRRIESNREMQPSDPESEMLANVRRWLADALVEAVSPEEVLTVEQLAAQEGVTVHAIYKRQQRGKLPGATKRAGRLVVPLNSVA